MPRPRLFWYNNRQTTKERNDSNGRRSDFLRHSGGHSVHSDHQDCGHSAAEDGVHHRALGQVPLHSRRGLPHPRAVLRPSGLPPHPEGAGDRRAAAGVHHEGQHRRFGRRNPLHAGDGSREGQLRHRELPLRDDPARADDDALRDGQARPRPQLRGAYLDQRGRGASR